ncbi:BCAM0308 family protein [Paraburkholderia tropica]|uniref:Glutamyl-tRNA amidotransferase n=1 Tax=Paraburkholderia tropica TaxID=92647 RepID=A0AAQ1GKP4_9BURK|nr:BCAM0308 family protein [Paraburkholderia tropica]RQN38236.1 glutamyl-tRNA amidotransferase [Paraburkholderia tropica]SEK08003.1 hypothetical protein SAMN05216550_116123 [Paraburkholderia tropica]
MNPIRNESAATGMRRDKRLQPHTNDSYRAPARVMSGTGCRECGAIYENGRWIWSASAEVTRQLLCPACRRIQDHAPAGELWLKSCDYLNAHLDQVVALLSREARNEAGLHALERIMDIQVQSDGVRVSTTGPHVLRKLTAAMLRAHHGRLSIEYRDGERLLRARWSHESRP